jgi:hypothetical protein
MSHSQKPQEALNPLVTEERYCALIYMSLYTFLHSLLNVLVQIANKMGLQKNKKSLTTAVLVDYNDMFQQLQHPLSDSHYPFRAYHVVHDVTGVEANKPTSPQTFQFGPVKHSSSN